MSAPIRLAVSCVILAALAGPASAQPKKKDAAPPKPPDAQTLETARQRTAKLREVIAALPKTTPEHVRADVEIYLKAAEWVVRHQEWVHNDSGKWLLATLDQGLERAAQAAHGKAPWGVPAGKTVSFAYRSKIDGSVQPYAVTYPPEFGKDPKKKWRLDIVLHGRDGAICETKFLYQHNGRPAPKDQDFIQLEPYGRGNNAYRWAGEADVFEALEDFTVTRRGKEIVGHNEIDPSRIVLRGFSMGGAGTWHIGLRHPDRFCAIAPGAGFTTTHSYVPSLPNPLPPYQEPLLHIYDALDYVENAFNVPIVAYSGENDAQKAAADNIEKRLKELKIGTMTHIVAPGLAHSFPADWHKKVLAELDKYAGPGKGRAEFPREGYAKEIRFVTYSLDSNRCEWIQIDELETSYSEARVAGVIKGRDVSITTKNVRKLTLGRMPFFFGDKWTLTIDGQKAPSIGERVPNFGTVNGTYSKNVRNRGEWAPSDIFEGTRKKTWSHGPIDDAFTGPFLCVRGDGRPGHEAMNRAAHAQLHRFVREWDKWMRGKLEVKNAGDVTRDDLKEKNLILFGDFRSNFEIDRLLPDKLPITWNEKDLIIGRQRYDPAKHLPMLVYPNPNNRAHYIVLNSGHTFHEAEFRGTNALLFPRLGDYAVVRPTPTEKDPAAFEVIKAGIFDDDWKFAEK